MPRSWIDVSTTADLDDICAAYAQRHRKRLRIATKYAQLTRAFFAHAGISDHRIVPSAGANEGTPTAGTAEWDEAQRAAADALPARLGTHTAK